MRRRKAARGPTTGAVGSQFFGWNNGFRLVLCGVGLHRDGDFWYGVYQLAPLAMADGAPSHGQGPPLLIHVTL